MMSPLSWPLATEVRSSHEFSAFLSNQPPAPCRSASVPAKSSDSSAKPSRFTCVSCVANTVIAVKLGSLLTLVFSLALSSSLPNLCSLTRSKAFISRPLHGSLSWWAGRIWQRYLRHIRPAHYNSGANKGKARQAVIRWFVCVWQKGCYRLADRIASAKCPYNALL